MNARCTYLACVLHGSQLSPTPSDAHLSNGPLLHLLMLSTIAAAAGCVICLDASSLSSLSAGASVTSWGSFNSPSDTTRQPTYYTNVSTGALNYKPFVRFTTSQRQYLYRSTSVSLNIASGGGFTAIVVAAVVSTGEPRGAAFKLAGESIARTLLLR